MMLASKWLEDRRFTWPPVGYGAIIITAAQMALLIDGLDRRVGRGYARRPYDGRQKSAQTLFLLVFLRIMVVSVMSSDTPDLLD